VVRRNFFHHEGTFENDTGAKPRYGPGPNGKWGNRNLQVDANSDKPLRNLIEGNRFGWSGAPPDDDGGDGVSIVSSQNIFRYNEIYGSQNNGILMKVSGNSKADGNRIYNNTILDAGRFRNDGPQWQGYSVRFYPAVKRAAAGNVFVNNILEGAAAGDFAHAARDGYDTRVDNTFVTNWLDADGDPLFVNPDTSKPDRRDEPNLALQSESAAVDAGSHLTTTRGRGSLSTTLTVDDALFFQDGTKGSALSDVHADWIAVGNVKNVVEIRAVDYDANIIVLSVPRSWNDGDRVWLLKDSSGRQVLSGSAPDLGAHEHQQKGVTVE
jgi:hypothetical protein